MEVPQELGRSYGFLVESRWEPGEQFQSFDVRENGVKNNSYKNEVSPSEGKRSAARRIVGSQSALIVPVKSANFITRRSRGREARHRNFEPLLGNITNAQQFGKVLTVQQRIAEVAQRSPEVAFTSLAHNIDLQWLEEAYRLVRKDGSAGIDDVTGKQYAENLRENLQNLLDRLQSGTYKAPSVKRGYIPKGNGEPRPIGIPTFEDKIAQRAVVMLLEPIYEHDFYDSSFGFRPKRSAHQALQAVWEATMAVSGGYVLEVDLRKFFDTLDHQHLREFVSIRVRDGVLRRLIGKWLKAGVMEDGALSFSDSGTPQGGVISPLLANIYLHYVLDTWFEQDVKPVMRGKCRLIRYADDFVIMARYVGSRITEWMGGLLEGRFGLVINRDKTKVGDVKRTGETLDFLGYTFRYDRDRTGRDHRYWNRIPSKKSMQKARDRVRELTSSRWGCLPLSEVVCRLNQFLIGWRNYFSTGYPRSAFHTLNAYVQQRMTQFLRRLSQRPFRPPVGMSWYHLIYKVLKVKQL